MHTKDNCDKAGERKDLRPPVRRQLISIGSLMVCEAAHGRNKLVDKVDMAGSPLLPKTCDSKAGP